MSVSTPQQFPLTLGESYPSLSYRSSTAATLIVQDHSAKWIVANAPCKEDSQADTYDNYTDVIPPLHSTLKTNILLPSNIEVDEKKTDVIDASTKAIIKQNSLYLRDAHPELYVPRDLLAEYIEESISSQRQDSSLIEAKLSNQLCISNMRLHNRLRMSAFFATPKHANRLQIRELDWKNSKYVCRKRSNCPVELELPMSIIGLHKADVGYSDNLPSLIAARSQFSTAMIFPYFKGQSEIDSKDTVIDIIQSFGNISSAQHHDVSFNNAKLGMEAAIINDHGEILIWTVNQASKGGRRTYSSALLGEWDIKNTTRLHTSADHARWEVQYMNQHTLYVKSPCELSLLDIRSPYNASKLFSCSNPKVAKSSSTSQIWSIDLADEQSCFLTTSKEVIWIDKRFASRPVLAWKHYLRPHTQLTSRVVKFNCDSQSSYDVMLWSKSFPLLMCYRFVSSGDPHVCMSNMDPYIIQISSGTLTGLDTVQAMDQVDLFTLRDDGHLVYEKLERKFHRKESYRRIHGSTSVKRQADTFFETNGDLFRKDYKVLDFSKIYQKISMMGSLTTPSPFRKRSENEELDIQKSHSLAALFGFPFDESVSERDVTSRLQEVYTHEDPNQLELLAKDLLNFPDNNEKELSSSLENSGFQILNPKTTINEASASLLKFWGKDMNLTRHPMKISILVGEVDENEIEEAERVKKRRVTQLSKTLNSLRNTEVIIPQIHSSQSKVFTPSYVMPADVEVPEPMTQPVRGAFANRKPAKPKAKPKRAAGF